MLVNRVSFIDAQQWNMITVNTSRLPEETWFMTRHINSNLYVSERRITVDRKFSPEMSTSFALVNYKYILICCISDVLAPLSCF